MSTSTLAAQLTAAASVLDAYPSTTDALRLLQGLSNAIDAAKVDLVAQMGERRDHEGEGCSSVTNWLRQQLCIDTRDARQLVRSATTLTDIPDLAEAAESGTVSLDHVDAFTYAARHIDPQVVAETTGVLLDLARTAEPATLRAAVKKLRDAAHPDDLDEAWIKGMAKHDIKLSPVGEGFHVTGFLPYDTGAKFRTVLQSLSAPTCAEDDRPVAERRVTALDQLLSSVLDGGLPQDKGVRPHLTLTVDLADLADDPATTTADLAGFGTIGPAQLQQMLCDATLTPVLTGGKHAVLDVGRTHRLATPHQRTAVVTRQNGRCAGHGMGVPPQEAHSGGGIRTGGPHPPRPVLVPRRHHRPREPCGSVSQVPCARASAIHANRPRHPPRAPHPAHSQTPAHSTHPRRMNPPVRVRRAS